MKTTKIVQKHDFVVLFLHRFSVTASKVWNYKRYMVKGYELTDCRQTYIGSGGTHVARLRCGPMKSKIGVDDSVVFAYVHYYYYCHLPPFPILSGAKFHRCVAWTHDRWYTNVWNTDRRHTIFTLLCSFAGLIGVKTHIAMPLAIGCSLANFHTNEKQ